MDGTTVSEGPDSVAVSVVEAVASAAGTDPLSMEPKLYDVVDADALERLISEGSLTRVTFEYDGYEVVVEGDGSVSVDDGTGTITVESATGEREPAGDDS
jgi:hypothetical protein